MAQKSARLDAFRITCCVQGHHSPAKHRKSELLPIPLAPDTSRDCPDFTWEVEHHPVCISIGIKAHS
eukprot:3316443-Amphidinium_carterae.3